MKTRHAVILALGIILAASAAEAVSYLNGFVGVCDPANPGRCIKPDTSGNVPVTMGASALPTGAATSALQTSVGATAHSDAGALLIPVPIPNAGAMTVTSASVGVASAQALAAGSRKYLFIQNVSLTASVGCRIDGGTAALNTAGAFMLTPGSSRTWEGSATPNAAITCIASAASTPTTIESL
jgi:hypothetical protein